MAWPRRGAAIEAVGAALAVFEPQPEAFDRMVARDAPAAPLRAETRRRALAVLCPGGHRILEACIPRQPRFGTGAPPSDALLIEPQEVLRQLTGPKLLVSEERAPKRGEPGSTGPYHRGRSAVVQAVGRQPD